MSATGVVRYLISKGKIEGNVTELAAKAKEQEVHPLSFILNEKLIDPWVAAELMAQEFGYPLIDVSLIRLDQEVVGKLDKKLIVERNILPIYVKDNTLFVAISDPTDIQAIEDAAFNTGGRVEPFVTNHALLTQAIEEVASDSDSMLDSFTDEGMNLDEMEVAELESKEEGSNGDADDDAPIVKFVNQVLVEAIKRGASDIHFEVFEEEFRIRFRQDGVLHLYVKPPRKMSTKIISRIKVMARLDITEKREPQDGRIKLKLSKTKAIDFRVNTCPTLFGEKVVLRILDPTSATLGIEKLGFEEDQQEALLKAIHKPQGMVLVTGPTGSGKTVTLYTCLNILNTMEKNISTAEDPAEINLKGINQVNVDDKTTFAKALKAFLRQDPDIIMVGEIRDIDTGEIAIKAAQTGHMVLSTLHTNDAPQTLSRLMNMGIEPYNIANAVSLIVAQRLARRLCPKCKEKDNLTETALLDAGFSQEQIDSGLEIFKANPDGCGSCSKGYKGRVGIYQVMPVSDEMAAVIMNGGSAIDLAKQAEREGVIGIGKSGLRKVAEGMTSLEEVERVTTVD